MNKVLDHSRRGSAERIKPGPTITHPITFHYEIQNHATRMQKLTNAFKVYRLTALTLICVLVGVVVGLICRPYAKDWTERQFMYIEMPGELYLRFLKLMIIPLLVSNVILSFGTIEGRISSRLGKIAGFLYLCSNLTAISVATLIALLISPGSQQISNINDHISRVHIQGYHYFDENYKSIKRYREYHPMFYHTDQNNMDEKVYILAESPQLQDLLLIKQDTLWLEAENSTRVHKLDRGELAGKLGETVSSSLISPGGPKRPPIFVESTAGRNQSYTSKVHRVGLSTKLPIDVLLDVLRNLVPDSIVGAAIQQARTRLFAPRELVIGKNGSTNPPPSHWPMGHEMVDQANIIGLLAVSVLTGVVLSHMEEASRPMLDLCACISELSLRIGMVAINLTPFCIMFLLIGQVARAQNLSLIAGELCMYCVTVITALLVHGLVLLPVVYYLTTKQSPFKMLFNMLEALVAAFATSSSSAALALSLNCLTEMDMNPVIVRAFGPLGSAFNMNGTAIFEVVGTIFIAQTLGVTLPLTSLLLVGLGSAVASLSTAGIPSSGMMTLVIVLDAVNLPALQLSLIYIVDFIIDRFRTVTNVWSASVICGLIDHLCPDNLFEEEKRPEKCIEMLQYRGSRATLSSRKSSNSDESLKRQIISVTITPPPENSSI